jgi:hypothetical protein
MVAGSLSEADRDFRRLHSNFHNRPPSTQKLLQSMNVNDDSLWQQIKNLGNTEHRSKSGQGISFPTVTALRGMIIPLSGYNESSHSGTEQYRYQSWIPVALGNVRNLDSVV